MDTLHVIVPFLYGTKVVFIHFVHIIELYVVFTINEIKICKALLMWLEQHYCVLVLDRRVVKEIEE